MKKDRIYFSDLKLLDDYDNEEAWKSAVNKRKFLFDRTLNKFDRRNCPSPMTVKPRNNNKQFQT